MTTKFTKTEIESKTNVVKVKTGIPAIYKYKAFINGVEFVSELEYGIQAVTKAEDGRPEVDVIEHHGSKKDFVNAVYSYLNN